LGFPPEKAIQKKYFTLMINQMEKFFESTIYYCLQFVILLMMRLLACDLTHIFLSKRRVIIKITNHKIGDKQMVLTTVNWNSIVNQCFNDYRLAQARKAALSGASAKLHNTLVQLHDFSTMVEAKRTMKDGNVGHLMIVWKQQSIMSQAMTGITNYQTYTTGGF
jgi:hypothetical protein